MKRRMRSTMVALGALLAAASLMGCDEEEPEFYRVCVDTESQLRVEDADCPEDGSGGGNLLWFYIPWGRSSPAVGTKVDLSSGSFTRPATGRVGTVSRGGFGGKGGSGG